MRLSHHVVVLFGVIAVCALAVSASATDFTVSITNAGGTAFQPANLTIVVGDRVRWNNRSALQHTSTSGTGCTGDGLWDTGFMNPNTFSDFETFSVAGTYPYFCVNHCLFNMVGSIQVNPKPVAVKSSTWGAIKALYTTGE